ncbi:hypothetical protein [Streptantibioticus silvisoli]|uniref:Uncharacterized protein n=1 Tax=Streptantibioticus silvisoli TaxID=2705255 RepID=A0ABT6W2C9_9ACTN|nr:hypothetical protein [Streptantibioticus silvisoli]MDI5964127.1 hypothetical protein [Streptantibioticus silvisoli]
MEGQNGDGVVTFRADHSLLSDRPRIKSALISGCPTGRTVETMGFFAKSEVSDAARTGSTVGLAFSRLAGPDCVTVNVDARRDAGRVILCVIDDPDPHVCGSALPPYGGCGRVEPELRR